MMERVRGIILNGKMTEEANVAQKKHEKEQYTALAQHEAERLSKKARIIKSKEKHKFPKSTGKRRKNCFLQLL